MYCEMSDTTARKQSGRPWPKGVSGNPAGRPTGARNHATRLAEELFEGQSEGVCNAVIKKALKGDMIAARIVVERLCPPRRDRPITFELPTIEGARDLSKAAIALLQSVAGGNTTPEEGASVMRLIEGTGKAIELAELEGRLAAIEAKLEAGK